MRKLLIGFLALFFTLPAFASVDHWTCSNEQTVMYLVLDTDDGNFMLWDDQGQFLVGAKFTGTAKTKSGTPFLVAELDGGTMIGMAKDENRLILAITKDGGDTAIAKFTCN